MKAEIYLNGWLVYVAHGFAIAPPIGSEMVVTISPRKRIECEPEIYRLKVERTHYDLTGPNPTVVIDMSKVEF